MGGRENTLLLKTKKKPIFKNCKFTVIDHIYQRIVKESCFNASHTCDLVFFQLHFVSPHPLIIILYYTLLSITIYYFYLLKNGFCGSTENPLALNRVDCPKQGQPQGWSKSILDSCWPSNPLVPPPSNPLEPTDISCLRDMLEGLVRLKTSEPLRVEVRLIPLEPVRVECREVEDRSQRCKDSAEDTSVTSEFREPELKINFQLICIDFFSLFSLRKMQL